MADRRLSRANWSTKTIKASARPPPQQSNLRRQIPAVAADEAITEEDEEDDAIEEGDKAEDATKLDQPAQSKLRRVTTSRPHRVDNSTHNRRFSVKISRADMAPLSNVPPLPGNAADYIKSSSTKGSKESQGHGMLRDLSSDHYDAVSYLHTNLRTADAATIDAFTSELSDMSLNNKLDVKRTIAQSLQNVIGVSESVAKTQETLQELKKVVGSLNEVIYQQVEDAQEALVDVRSGSKDDGSSSSGSHGNSADKRRSLIILEKKWASNMNALFKEVDGAQQFVSALPGRHVIAQSKRWGELNAVTWKPIRPAHLTILNDYLLVATRKRIDDKKRTIATGCWPIKEVSLEEKKGPSNVAGADSGYTLSFKTHNASLLFQTDSQNDYNKVKSAFRKAKADSHRISETGDMRNRNLRKSINRLSSDRANRNSDILHDLSSQLNHRRARSRDLKQKTITERLNAIEENMTNVEIYMGHHKFEESVGFINRLKDQLETLEKTTKSGQNDSQLKFLLRLKQLKLQELTDELVESLSWDISNWRSSGKQIADKLELFRLLGLEDKGRTVLLASKTKQLEELVTSVKFEGDLRNYMLQVSILYFSFISQIYTLYEQCFPVTKDKTFIIEWANERVSNYNNIFHRQLIDYDTGSQMYESCTKIARSQSERLKRMGMNVDYLFDFK
ncbi:DEKNAAC103341 [Brettanomyces naardenensis]|uniref:Exocyst complex component EXO84 n=1 Tax=Brettanomyces naardenensis TaxID=13370 RepID=A0A448YNR9_BRENA|nr:DEKNAAC103341 [Brettanomyces naardenensis]